jgi:hypothetical protein
VTRPARLAPGGRPYRRYGDDEKDPTYLTAEDPAQIEAGIPAGAAAGERYPTERSDPSIDGAYHNVRSLTLAALTAERPRRRKQAPATQTSRREMAAEASRIGNWPQLASGGY